MAATFHLYLPLHCYCSVHTDPLLIYIKLMHCASNTQLKSYRHKCEKNTCGCKMQTNNCNDLTNKCTHITYVHMCLNFQLVTTKTWVCTTVCRNIHTQVTTCDSIGSDVVNPNQKTRTKLH